MRSDDFSFGLDAAYTLKLKDVLTLQAARMQAAAEAGLLRDKHGAVDFDADAKFVDAVCEKYNGRTPESKVAFASLIGFAKPLVDHETTIGESFNKADSTTLGPDQTWTEFVTAELQVVSNQATSGSNASENHARAEADLSSNDSSSQVSAVSVATSTARSVGTCGRYSSSVDTAYALRLFGNASGATGSFARVFRAYTIVAGSITAIGTGTNQASALPVPIKLEMSGTTLTLIYNGSSVESFTDATIDGSIVGGKRSGIFIRGLSGASIVDDLSAADLGAVATTNFLTLLGVG